MSVAAIYEGWPKVQNHLVARLPNLRWTQSIVEAFSRIEGLTRERRRVATWYNHFGGTIAPVLKIAGWNFTGKQSAALG